MAEEIFNDYFPDLIELENKIGRKTPESLLTWMRTAANCEDGWKSEVTDRENHSTDCTDTLSDRINNLKQEMRWLRSADVKILKQLVALHEGIEAMRWLLEDRGPLTSHGSSLTGSLSSLELTQTTGEDSADRPSQPPHTAFGDSDLKSYVDTLSSPSSEATPLSPSSSKFMVSHTIPGNHGRTSFRPANGLNSKAVPQLQDSFSIPPDVRRCGDTIKRVLLRSSRPRKSLELDTFVPTQQLGETQTVHQTQGSFTAPQTTSMEKEDSAPSEEKLWLGYDAHWSWMESEDDVTFV
uniref:Leucine rich adaptor protein 1 n=1 Tax=Amphilophus citrinellus TaxID=61819 RepID=A0A3Q0RPU1_AMPCI